MFFQAKRRTKKYKICSCRFCQTIGESTIFIVSEKLVARSELRRKVSAYFFILLNNFVGIVLTSAAPKENIYIIFKSWTIISSSKITKITFKLLLRKLSFTNIFGTTSEAVRLFLPFIHFFKQKRYKMETFFKIR